MAAPRFLRSCPFALETVSGGPIHRRPPPRKLDGSLTRHPGAASVEVPAAKTRGPRFRLRSSRCPVDVNPNLTSGSWLPKRQARAADLLDGHLCPQVWGSA